MSVSCGLLLTVKHWRHAEDGAQLAHDHANTWLGEVPRQSPSLGVV